MLHHVSIGVADVGRAATFYDTVLATLGYKRVMEFMPYAVAYGDTKPEFWVQRPANQSAAAAGNGVHIAFQAATKEAIDAFHRAALGAGATDEGGAGPRPDYGPDYYGAFVRDPDGNKIEAVLAPPPAAVERPTAARPAKRKAKKKRPAAAAKRAGKKKVAKKAGKKTGRKKAKRRR